MSNLRARLTYLVLLALLPSIVLLLLFAESQRAWAEEQARQSTVRAGQVISSIQEVFTERIEDLLRNLAQISIVADGLLEDNDCERIFGALLEGNPEYANFGLMNMRGNIACSALPVVGPVNIADRDYIQKAVTLRRFSIGTYQVGRVTERPTLNFGYPVLDHGEIVGVLYAALDLAWLQETITNMVSMAIIDNVEAYVIDSQRLVLANYPPRLALIGQELPDTAAANLDSALVAAGVYTVRGADNVERTYFASALHDAELTDQIYLLMVAPADEVYGLASRILRSSLVAIGAILVLAVLAIWLGGEVFVMRQVRAIVDGLRHIRDGQLNTRLVVTTGELGAIASAANEMAQTLEDRVERIRQQESELSTLYRALSALFVLHDLKGMAHSVAQVVVDCFDQVDCGVMLVDEQTGYVTRYDRAGEFAVHAAGTLHIDGPGLVPVALRTAQSMCVPDVTQNEHYVPSNTATRSELVIPLIADQRVFGVIDLQSPQVDAFSPRDRRILEAFADRAASALDNARLYTLLRQINEDLERRVMERTADLEAALAREKELSELKARFIAMISHEFKTPLSIIRSSNELVTRYGDRMTADKRQQHLNVVQIQVQRLNHLIDEVIFIHRADAVGIDFKPVRANVDALCADIINENSLIYAGSHTIEYGSTLTDDDACVDPTLCRLMMNNLVGNAIKYSNAGTHVKVMLEGDADTLMISVKDQGIGIPPEDLDRLFEDFHRGSNTANFKGSGVGLAVVRRVIDCHGGHVTVDSTVGQGSTFTVYLPRNRSDCG